MGKTINQLSSVDSLQGGDQVVIYDASNGDARKASMTVMQTYMQDNLDFGGFVPQFVTQHATGLVTGFSVQVTDGSESIFLVLTSSATLATGTVVLPLVANVIDKQEVLILSVKEVTTFTINLNGATSNIPMPTTITAGGFYRLRYDATTGFWYRVG